MENLDMDLENKENIIKYADDIMNYSLDSLNLANTTKYNDTNQSINIGPALISADSVESQKQHSILGKCLLFI